MESYIIIGKNPKVNKWYIPYPAKIYNNVNAAQVYLDNYLSKHNGNEAKILIIDIDRDYE